MARTYNFAVLRLAPDELRGEAINLGIVVFRGREIDVRVGHVLTRARALYPEINSVVLEDAVGKLKRFGPMDLADSEKYRLLSRLGPFLLGDLGYFTCEDDRPETYDKRLSNLLATFVRAPRSIGNQARQSRLVTDVRRMFRSEKVLASVGDAAAISDHKVVPEWPLPGRPSLRADLALRNGSLRVCEIVELKMEEDLPPPTGLFSGMVTLEIAKEEQSAQECIFAYRASGPKVRIDEALGLAELRATKLVNWDRKTDRETFLHEWIAVAQAADKQKHYV